METVEEIIKIDKSNLDWVNTDIIYTKDDMGKYLLTLIDFNNGDVVMEPCRGKGSFYNNFPSYTDNRWCEISDGIDYLGQNQIVDFTISNPPFAPRKLFWDFHLHAMKTTRKEIWWLINMGSLNVFTPNRIEIMDNYNWFIQKFHIVTDKRWFGRYVFVQFTREQNDLLTYTKKVF